MDALKLLESIEELLYRIALWIVLLPRTLWFILSKPGHIFQYVTDELEKTPDKRFDDFISPALFFVIAGLVPHMMLLDLLAGLADSRVATEPLWINFTHSPWATRLTVVSVVALAGPLGFSVRSLRTLSVAPTRTTLRLPFLVQCYCFTPAYIALLPIVYFILRYDGAPPGVDTWISGVLWTMIMGWLVVTESLVLARQQATSHVRAVVRMAFYFVYVFVLLIVLELAVITIFQGFGVWTD